ncbi:serine hydrolase domain-containing protein [Roseisolibacter agri]|uniref:serine hydrolase domain-containing protein n=1 Tax=Roseisolibacter agri TaxID=2014610 RepID=UPI0024E09CA5|nr:serine hydrolase domain-containing protein [Roseisolibacter agri]
MRLARLLALTPLLATPVATPTSARAQAALDTAAIERVLRQEMRATRSPGVAIAVVRRGRVVYQKGFGVASVETGEPVTATTLFRIGSTTKMVTGLTAALLAHEGKLRLDAPLASYARGLSSSLGRLTLDQLLTHRAGMINEASGAGPHDDAALATRVRGWGREHVFGPANDVYSYSGPGYWLAGYAIEQAGGAFYADIVRAKVLAPLGMTRSTFRPLEAMTWPLAQDHRVRDTTATVLRPFTDDVTTWASGSLFSSASELARLTIAIMNGGRVDGAQALPDAAVALMTQPRAPIPGGEGCRYAYGLSACVRGGVRTLSHYGFRVGSGSVVTMAPDSQAAVIVLANRNGGILAGTAAAVMAQLVGEAGADVRARPDSAAPRAVGSAERFVGAYANGPDTLHVLARSGGLAYRYGADESPARLDGADAIVVLDAKGAVVQRFMLVAGTATRQPYLHDGLNAFARVGRPVAPRAAPEPPARPATP